MFGARARRTAAEAAAVPATPHAAARCDPPASPPRLPSIPREIFKKIRQIAIRTNRPVSETLVHFGAGERARLGRSQRRPRRWLRVARVQTDSLAPRRNVRREGAPNGSRGGGRPATPLSAFHIFPAT